MVPLALHRRPDGRTQYVFAQEHSKDTSHLGIQVRRLPGRGFGVIALRDFERGERIVAEAPLIAWHTRTKLANTSRFWPELDALVDELDVFAQGDFFLNHILDLRSFFRIHTVSDFCSSTPVS